MHDRQPTSTNTNLEALSDSERRVLLAKGQTELGRRAVMSSLVALARPENWVYWVKEEWKQFQDARQKKANIKYRARQMEAAPNLGFIDPSDMDHYTVTDLKIINAFYKEAALREPDGKVYLPANVDPDA